MRWTDRLLGLVSTLVLARLLVPADFGLVAMAMVVVGLLDVLLDLGVSAALIQNRAAGSEDFHTAWTLRLAQATVAALILVAFAPLVASYYNDARVVAILRVVAITVFVGGLENIGTVSFQRNMEFGRDFQFFFLKRVSGVAVAIAVAIILRSYWALVIGSLVSRLAGVGVSYWVSGFRPRLSLARFSRIWSFSQWNIVAGIGSYLYLGIGRFVIGGRASAEVLGGYSVGEEIASMPTTELLAPLGRVMFPAFAGAKHDSVELLRLATLALSVQALIAIPASVGVALVAGDAIPLLLGAKWVIAVPFAQIVALANIAVSLGHSAVYLLTALGQIRTICIYQWSRVLSMVALVVVIFPMADAQGVAQARLATGFVGLIVLQSLAGRALPGFVGLAMLRHIWRPLLSSAIMAMAVLEASRLLDEAAPIARLAAAVSVGAVTYGLAILLLWRAFGSPPGAETYILEKLKLARQRGSRPTPKSGDASGHRG